MRTREETLKKYQREYDHPADVEKPAEPMLDFEAEMAKIRERAKEEQNDAPLPTQWYTDNNTTT